MSDKKRINPPKWPKRLFEWFCNEAVAEDLTGDMDEIFHNNLKKMSPIRASLKYCLQVLVLIISYGVKTRKGKYKHQHGSASYYSLAMYNSYSKIAFRSLAKQKTFSLINIICLSVGMSIGLLALAAYVDVSTVDNFQANASKIFRVTTQVDDANEKITYASSSAPLGERLKQEATGIEEIAQIASGFNPEIIQSANTVIPLEGYYADPGFLKIFSFQLLEGNPKQALAKPFSIILTQSAAKKLFHESHVVGKILEVKGLGNFEITGIVQDYPRSHLYFEVIASYNTIASLEQQQKIQRTLHNWGPVTNFYTYLLLNENKEEEDVAAVADKIINTQFTNDQKLKVSHKIQAIKDIPMSDLNNEIGLSWGYVSLAVFFFLALLVLLPACFNYTNIAIARALKRAKEIGLRKVSGGESRHIFMQMVMETVILSIISLIGSIFIFMAIRESFLDMIVGGARTFDLELTPLTIFAFFLFAIFTGVMAGAFPAVYFSKLNPIETLRNSSQSGKLSKISIRKGLIVAQFALSMIFILGVAILVKQYRYALNYDLGFQKENILDISLKGVNEKILITTLERIPEVTSVSLSSSIPGNWLASSVMVKHQEKHDSLEVYQMFVDHNYINNLEIKLIAGTSFPENASEFEEYIIVNETFAKKFGFGSPFDALSKSVVVGNKELRVIGVVKDFNFMPLQEAISSFFFRMDPSKFNFANVKLKSQDIRQTLSKMESSWNKISDQKFEARFLDDELEASLISFKSMVKIFGFLGAIAIVISCLGLLAVVISSAESRMREMGIRKVFGASVVNLAINLSKTFVKLIAVAVVIATPVTYFLFDQFFLRMIFYRASIGFMEIALSIVLLFTLVFIIIGSQTLKVARINPVETLKYE